MGVSTAGGTEGLTVALAAMVGLTRGAADAVVWLMTAVSLEEEATRVGFAAGSPVPVARLAAAKATAKVRVGRMAAVVL